MKIKLIIMTLGLAVSAPSIADEQSFWDLPIKGTFDYRHEYRTDSEVNNDKFQINLSQGNFLLENIAYITSGTDPFFSNQRIGSYEMGLYHITRLHPKLVFVPGFAYSISTNENNLYIPSLRFNYLTDNRVRIHFRYKQILSSKNTVHNQAFDGYIGYKFANGFDATYQINYTHAINGNMLWNSGNSDYFQNLKVRYDGFGRIRPYAEIGDVKVHAKGDDRQLRYRVGVQYKF